MGNYRLNHQQFPVWKLGIESRAGVFHSKTQELCSENLYSWLLTELSASSNPKRAELKLRGSYRGPCLCFSLTPSAIHNLLWIPSLPPNPLKEKLQLSKCRDPIGLVRIHALTASILESTEILQGIEQNGGFSQKQSSARKNLEKRKENSFWSGYLLLGEGLGPIMKISSSSSGGVHSLPSPTPYPYLPGQIITLMLVKITLRK